MSEQLNIPKATHRGEISIGDVKIPCAVLNNGKRVISETGINKALLGTRTGGSIRQKKFHEEVGSPLPIFLAPTSLKPFISNDLLDGALTPIEYQDGKRIIKGFDASILPAICDIWLKAREANVLQKQQLGRAQKAETLMRGLAHIGIIALVDEATGYQEVRDRNELNRILEAYIAKELLPWTKRFPDEFYGQLFRLLNWQYSPLSAKRPGYVGTLTNQLVYEKLPPGVLDELRAKNPSEKGRRKHKHHQFLTEDIGNPHLEKHLTSVITLMRISPNYKAFKKYFDKAFPPPVEQIELFEPEDDEIAAGFIEE